MQTLCQREECREVFGVGDGADTEGAAADRTDRERAHTRATEIAVEEGSTIRITIEKVPET